MAVAFAALEDRLAQLENALNTNTKAFSDGIQMIEAQQEVLRRVAKDICNRRVRFVNLGAVELNGARTIDMAEDIDWNGYLKSYIEELVEAEAKEKKAGPSPVIASADDDAPIIFGGESA